MAYSPYPIGVGRNPLVNSVFVHQFEEQGDFPPPPSTKFMITETSAQMVTELGVKMITE